MRLIDADELMEKFNDIEFNAKHELFGESRDLALEGLKHIKKALKGMPTIDPIKHGEWITVSPNYSEPDDWYCECSLCRCAETDTTQFLPNYCPKCGAKMDGGSNE